jgi:Subtilase family
MTTNYRTDHVLVRADAFRPEDIGRLNDILDDAKLGRPLGEPAGGRAPLISVPILDDTDPADIQAAVQTAIAAAGPGGGPPELMANPVSHAGTVTEGEFFTAAGKKSGHGMGWVPAPLGEMPDAPSWDPAGSHPVIALLDSGVQPHPWFSGLIHFPIAVDPGVLDPDGSAGPPPAPEVAGPPFLLDADGMDGWHSPLRPENPALRPFPPGTHWGHGTFIAGLLRQAAPHAKVLSMRVMDSMGHVDDCAVLHALTWLYQTTAIRANVVLMAFGRQAAEHDPILADVRDAMAKLAGQGVKVVASAGNDASDKRVYPAAFAEDLGPNVISVGAVIEVGKPAPFSNFGPWVKAGWLGTDIVSISPQTFENSGDNQTDLSVFANPPTVIFKDSFAWWSGTSFAAAIAAGRLASGQKLHDMPLPHGTAQP